MTLRQSPDFEAMRAAMVASQLRTSGVTDTRLLDAMGRIPREDFVPSAAGGVAYIDRPVALANGRALNPPIVTALLFDAARIMPGDRVLIVGAATGYSTAIARALTDHVVAIESDDALAESTAKRGQLESGYPEGAPYDAIILDGAVEFIPDALIDQLADGGRLAAGTLDNGVVRLQIGRRAGRGFGTVAIADFDAVPLPGFRKAKVFAF